MRFYEQQHPFYCGVDLHARTMHVCVLDHRGQVLVHQNIDACPDAFLCLTAAWRKRNMVVGCRPTLRVGARCSPGSGWPTCARSKAFPSCWATPCT